MVTGAERVGTGGEWVTTTGGEGTVVVIRAGEEEESTSVR